MSRRDFDWITYDMWPDIWGVDNLATGEDHLPSWREKREANEMANPMRFVRFKCMDRKCGAEDRWKGYETEMVPQVINCWQCHGGLQMTTEQMIGQGRGMQRVQEETYDGKVITDPAAGKPGPRAVN